MRLADKVALIVGAGVRSTRAIALLFSREGAKIALMARRANVLEETAQMVQDGGGQALVLPGDATRAPDVARAVAETVAAYGRLDILYNNVGGGFFRDEGRLEVDDQRFAQIMDTNLKSCSLCAQYAVPQMVQGGGGVLLFVTTTFAISQRGTAAFAAARSGIVALTKIMAKEYAKDNIRVNCIALGRYRGEVDPQRLEPIREPLASRVSHPIDIAYAALYLASDEASWVSGIVLPLDGADAVQ